MRILLPVFLLAGVAPAPARAAARASTALVAAPTDLASDGMLRFKLRPSAGVQRAVFAIDGRTVDVDRGRPFAGRLEADAVGTGRHLLSAQVWRRGRPPVTLRRHVSVSGAPDPRASQLVWSDEFDGPAGAPPDPKRWQLDTGRWRDGGELEYYTDRPENIAMDGAGYLRITARREWYGGARYTSARIRSQDRFEPFYGHIEARIRVPAGRGLLPAFWMLGHGAGQQLSWPDAGEIDVMEVTGNDPFTWWGHVHGPQMGAPGEDASEGRWLRAPTRFSDDFHVFAVDWRANLIQFSVDGVPVGAPLTPATYAAHGGRWVHNRPFFLLLNLAVGNAWTGPPSITTRWPATMVVDWVRVYA